VVVLDESELHPAHGAAIPFLVRRGSGRRANGEGQGCEGGGLLYEFSAGIHANYIVEGRHKLRS
jgi:hypothetical protein